ncbi:peptidylprolyl isomerase [Roseococcus sp. SDR]|uniref:peptidylprolyl isomerase n=1 Tax=Roseococcus sp. SDR TaxID=2835532 RepID=UPI0020BFDC3E|nr:peptidylprolyl isomerase [Roseococcus sp. SDR]
MTRIRPRIAASLLPPGLRPRRLLPLGMALLLALGAVPMAVAQPRPGAAPEGAAAPAAGNRILAVVNGDPITQAEVTSRSRLFALNVGMGVAPEILTRLQPQVLRLAVDERLRIQEIQRRRIGVSDTDIAEAIADIERRNNLPPGSMRNQLRNAGIQPRVLFDQIRAQIGWGRLLRQALGPLGEISEQEVADAIASRRAQEAQAEYLVSEIYLPVDDPANEAEVRRFADEVIGQIRRGSPFPVVASQFSQAQTALGGGDVGWVGVNQLDPEVAAIVTRMPPGAVSNPIRVAGGFQIVTLRARREGGTAAQLSTMLTIRQVFTPFDRPLDPQAPTEQQRAVVERAQRLSQTLRGCEQVDALPRSSDRPTDPGPIRLEGLNPPALRSMLASLPIGRPSQPVIAPDGVLLLMVCSREQRNMNEFTPDAARQQILRDRVELLSRQLQRDLRRRAVIEMRV